MSLEPSVANETDTSGGGASAGTLYVVATPIGNLGDITLRAIEVLRQSTLIVAEDTRRSRALLSHLGITGKSVRCIDAHATANQIAGVVEEVRQGNTVALLTDAGTPSVSDPGTELVRACRQAELGVIPVPGPSAVTAAVAGSGLVDQGFWFIGFLPRKGPKRKAILDRIEAWPDAIVLFEAAPRVSATLVELAERQPERQLCVARELTKKFEEFVTAPLAQWAKDEREFRGELTLVLAPVVASDRDQKLSQEACEELARELLTTGQSPRDVANELSERSGLGKRDAYQLVLKVRD